MARVSFLALALGVLAFTGCSAGSGSEDAGQNAARYEIVLKSELPNFDEPLPADFRFVATRRYEVEISTRSRRSPRLCDQLAASYFPHEPRRRWPPPYLRSGNPDLASSLVCALGRGAERAVIKYGPADCGRLDAEGVCEALRRLGWTRQSWWEALDLL